MKRLLFVLLLAWATLSLAQQAAKKSTDAKPKSAKTAAKNAFTPQEMKWGPPPPFVPAGAQVSVLEGNPMASTGRYTIRVKAPENYKIAPHSHPKREEVTIISGALKLGMGDKWDDAKLTTYPAGAYFYMDPSMHHFAVTQGETEFQISGPSPFAVIYVNQSDDPSKKK